MSDLPTHNTTKQQQQKLVLDNFIVHHRLNQAKFSIYLVSSPKTDELYAMKIYPITHSLPNLFFLNEIRFSKYDHPNVISILGYQPNTSIKTQGNTLQVSYLVMELAPYGDLFDLFTGQSHLFDEKLVRTYFHHLIEGLGFLHEHGVCHLDLKLENLLIGEDFILKIADFDTSYMEGDGKVHALGTKYYRAPEILSKTCGNPKPADIYSAGVILFMLYSQGVLPHLEDQVYQGVNLLEALNSDPERFWAKHCEISKRRGIVYTQEFRELFIGMTKSNPEERFSIMDIKASTWYNGEVYSGDELVEKMQELV